MLNGGRKTPPERIVRSGAKNRMMGEKGKGDGHDQAKEGKVNEREKSLLHPTPW